MEARDRRLPDWFTRVRTGQLRLPRFQRFESWSYDRVASLLETVLRGLPSGATLILEVGDKELFKSRSMAGVPAPTERVTEHLLDGQQRLTALWRSLHDHYEDRTYFVKFEADEDHDGAIVPRVTSQSRWYRNGTKYPVWADEPVKVHQKGYLPVNLLRPGDIDKGITAWCRQALGDDPDADAVLDLKDRINDLRNRVNSYNLPFLSLPVGTPKDVALDVFIQMNTSAVELSAFDIVVAQVEEETGQSLHELVAALKAKAPTIDAYGSPPDLMLRSAAMREDRSPTQASFQRLDLKRLVSDWDKLAAGLNFAAEFLETEHVYDAERLPTDIVIPVLAAAFDVVPPALDARGNAEALLRRYLWRAFVTRRYESSAGSRSLQDLRGLRAVIAEGKQIDTIPIFDENEYPLPTIDEIKRARWPKTRDILSRGILGASLRQGALDLADGTPATRSTLPKREYHHLFPDALLKGDGQMKETQSYLALNCALVTWNTNRNISAKEPLTYLKERVKKATLGELVVKSRLQSHLIPYNELNVGGYTTIADQSERAKRIQTDYGTFLDQRAAIIRDLIATLV